MNFDVWQFSYGEEIRKDKEKDTVKKTKDVVKDEPEDPEVKMGKAALSAAMHSLERIFTSRDASTILAVLVMLIEKRDCVLKCLDSEGINSYLSDEVKNG